MVSKICTILWCKYIFTLKVVINLRLTYFQNQYKLMEVYSRSRGPNKRKIAICSINCVQIWKGRDQKTVFCRQWWRRQFQYFELFFNECHELGQRIVVCKRGGLQKCGIDMKIIYLVVIEQSSIFLNIYLAWPFTTLQNDNITISWDFFQADSTKVSQHGCWCCQPEKISWYRNIIIL